MPIIEENFFLDHEISIFINHKLGLIRLLHQASMVSKKRAEDIHKLILKFKNIETRLKTNKIGLIINSNSGLEIIDKKLKTIKTSIQNYYNDDFKRIDKVIKQRINQDNDKGLILLHGLPGTGKTSYIKHLIQHTKKEVLFIPSNMAESITNPMFLKILIRRKNFILIIEDAEKIILNREHNNNNSAVSALLNLSDGILSDCLNVQIICSFNTDVSKIDQALMRKGRLIASYEFKALETEKANALSKNLGFDSFFTEPQTLTNIFNQDDKNYSNIKKQVIGF